MSMDFFFYTFVVSVTHCTLTQWNCHCWQCASQ